MNEYNNISTVINDSIYKIVENSLKTNSSKFLKVINDFFNTNSSIIFDIAPYDIVYYRASDVEKIFSALNISELEIKRILSTCYYWKLAYNPACAKDPYVIVCLCAIQYYMKNKKIKEANIVATYLSFSGKFYASLFAAQFPTVYPARYKEVMDYVVNNMLNGKHNLKSKGTVFGAIHSMCETWTDTYSKQLTTNMNDDEYGKLLQQLRTREKLWLANIAKLYMEAYQNKNYLNMETDNLADGEGFRLTDNDSLKATRYTESALNYMVTNSISLKICNSCTYKNASVSRNEIKDIMESIVGDKSTLDQLRRVINILICDFMSKYPDKSVGSIDFMSYSLAMKPNTKDPNILELKSIILSWLDEKSANYRRRKNRKATAIDYYRACLAYIVMVINITSGK